MRTVVELLSLCANVATKDDEVDCGCSRCFKLAPEHEDWCEVGQALAGEMSSVTKVLTRLIGIENGLRAFLTVTLRRCGVTTPGDTVAVPPAAIEKLAALLGKGALSW
jgi:hypothetical protein